MTIQRRVLVMLAAAALVLAACAETPLSPLDHAAQPEITLAEELVAVRTTADPDMSLYLGEGPTAGSGTILIYDIKDGFVYEKEDDEPLLLYDAEAIRDATGEIVFCRFLGNQLLDSQTGAIVYRGAENLVYDGEGRLSYSIKRDQMFAGRPTKDNLLVTASGRIDKASAQRKLLIAALVGGECGAPPLPQR